MKSILVENGHILGKSTRGAKFLLILTALFGHQPTYKNLRGNTAYDVTQIVEQSSKSTENIRRMYLARFSSKKAPNWWVCKPQLVGVQTTTGGCANHNWWVCKPQLLTLPIWGTPK